MWPWRTCGFFGLFLTACVVAIYYPIVAVANYMLVYQIVPGSRWWGSPVHALGVRFSLWAAMTLVIGIVATWATGRAQVRRPFLTTWELLVALLVAIAILGYTTAETPHARQWTILEKFCKMVFFLFCMTHLVSTRRHLRVVFWALVIGSLYLGHEAYTTPSREFLTGRLTSIGGPDFHDSSGFSAHMAAMLPLIGVTFLTARGWRHRLLPLISSAYTFNAIVLCRTRSAFLGLVAGGVTAALMVPRSWRWKAYPALFIFGIGAYSLVDQHFIDRMETMVKAEERENDAAISIRRELWDAGLRMVNDHPLGVGIGKFPIQVGQYEWHLLGRSSHNTFILCITELGVPGFFVFVAIIVTSVYQLLWAYRHSDDTDRPAETRLWAYGVLISLVIYLVAGQFTERFYTESFWWVLAISTCVRRVALNEAIDSAPVRYADDWMHEDVVYARRRPCPVDTGPRFRRVLHVVNALDGGGMERTLLAVVRATAGDHWGHAICTLRGPGPLADRVPASVPLLSLHARPGSRSTSLRLARVIGRFRPDLVHARSWGVWTDAAFASALAGRRPLVLGFHGLDEKSGFSPADRWRAHVLRRLSRRFACVSHAGRDQLAGQLGIPSDQIDVIPNGVDIVRFAPPGQGDRAAGRAALGFAPDEFVAGTVGNLTPVKDHATMLQAIRHCRDAGADVRLLLAGDGPLRSALTRQAADLDIASQVVFAGTRGDIPALLGAMDLYVCSSRSEGMSNAILEAMAVGLPVVATDVGDNGRLVDDGAVGALVPPGDPTALGAALLRLWRDPAQRAADGRSARARAMSCYPFAQCVERHVELYQALASTTSYRSGTPVRRRVRTPR